MKLNEFINQVLISEIGQILKGSDFSDIINNPNLSEDVKNTIQSKNNSHVYLSFGLISQGIELLGALMDRQDIILDRSGESRNRFEKAIIELFDNKYHNHIGNTATYDLYGNLRCGMLHSVVPKSKLLFGESHNKGTRIHMLASPCSDGIDRLFVEAEELYNDFESACKKIIVDLESKNFTNVYPESKNSSQNKQEIINLTKEFLRTDLL